MDGLHIVANLYRCAGEVRCLTERAALRDLCLGAIGRAGLTVLGELFHQFDGGGVTGCVVLAESHVAIHTWPEFGTVTLDAFVCNYSRDNSAHARVLVEELVARFEPQNVVRHELPRDLAAAPPATRIQSQRRAAG